MVPIIYCTFTSHPNILMAWNNNTFNLLMNCNLDEGFAGDSTAPVASGWSNSQGLEHSLPSWFTWMAGKLVHCQQKHSCGLEPWFIFTEASPWAAEGSATWQLGSRNDCSKTGSEKEESGKNLTWKLAKCHFRFISLVRAATEPAHI